MDILNPKYLVTVFFGLVSIIYLTHGFSNLLTGDRLPVDLALRYWQTKDLIFRGINIYAEQVHAQYPPSFFLFLSPFVGFTPYAIMDKVWLFLNLFSLSAICYILFRLYPQRPTFDKTILCLSFLTFHSIAQGLGVGQVSVLITGALISSYYLVIYKKNTFFISCLAILFFSFSLGKYSLLIPFVIPFLFNKKTTLITLVSILFNVIVSHFVLLSSKSTIPNYITSILKNASIVNNLGSLDVQALTSFIGASNWINLILISLLFAILFLSIFKYKISFIDQLAISAIVARFFIYHAHYDNVILIFLLIAVWNRIPSFKTWNKENILFSLVAFSLIIPARFLEWHYPFIGIGLLFQLVIWLYSGYFLIKHDTSNNETKSQPHYSSL